MTKKKKNSTKSTKNTKSTKSTKIVPDTSVLIGGVITDLLNKGEIKQAEIIIPEFVLEELRAQASKGREVGFHGLEEIKKLREYDNLSIKKTGRRQTYEEIQLAKYGRIDALIIDVAREEGAVLYTSDYVQHMTAEAEGIPAEYFEPYEKKKEISLHKMMPEDAMSLYLKEDTQPAVKRGDPGNIRLEKLRDEKITKEEIEDIIREVMDTTRYEEDSFVEIGGHKASVVQMGNMRIAIARPPFSDGLEVTVVRPTVKLTLDDYELSEKLKSRLAKRAEGVLIAGPPGSGKSTFAASLAEFYENKGNIVKTMETPRDLQVKKEITQYTKLKGSFENTSDLLLLVRPDYTIFDEVRKTEDFATFSDMRLAGIGMVGVVHASDPIDAVQRFMGRTELGMIPHILDTVIFIKGGRIEKVFYLTLTVRTPTGMTEADLARPVVEVKDFETNALEYEIYTYGEETVIIPVKAGKESPVSKLAKQAIRKEMKKYDSDVGVNIISDERAEVIVDNDVIARIIGKKGSNIQKIEERLGIGIEVTPRAPTLGKELEYETEETGAYIVLTFDEKHSGKSVNLYMGDEYVLSATIGKSGQVRVAKDSDVGNRIMKGLVKSDVRAFV